jgi:hypothetical protein
MNKLNENDECKKNTTELSKKVDYTKKTNFDREIIASYVAEHRFFLSHGVRGQVAFTLYNRLKLASITKFDNPVVRATDSYLKNGLKWGDEKLSKAKSFLKDHNYIEYIQERDESTGRFGEKYIRIKKNLDKGSVANWLQKHSVGIHESKPETPEDNDFQDDSEFNKDDEKCTTMNVIPQDRPNPEPDNKEQTNKEFEKEIYKKEEKKEEHFINPESSQDMNFSDFSEFCRYLESQIEKDGKGSFFFPSSAKDSLKQYYNIKGFNWTFEQYEKYKSKKTAAQVRRFCETDLPKFLSNPLRLTPTEKNIKIIKTKTCPSCLTVFYYKSTTYFCPICNLDTLEFKNTEKVEESRKAYEISLQERDS